MVHFPANTEMDAGVHIISGTFPSQLEGEKSQIAISTDGRRCIATTLSSGPSHRNEAAVYVLSATKGDVKIDFKPVYWGDDQPKWINENLLFLRIWRGRHWGTDYIFNADTKQIIYREGFADHT
jgi:hypothetical protein